MARSSVIESSPSRCVRFRAFQTSRASLANPSSARSSWRRSFRSEEATADNGRSLVASAGSFRSIDCAAVFWRPTDFGRSHRSMCAAPPTATGHLGSRQVEVTRRRRRRFRLTARSVQFNRFQQQKQPPLSACKHTHTHTQRRIMGKLPAQQTHLLLAP